MYIQHSRDRAIQAAKSIRAHFSLTEEVPYGLILGTGWGEALPKSDTPLPFKDIPGFQSLDELPGHARALSYLELGGKKALVLSGRVHMNEHPTDANVPQMVRLQIQMLIECGVKMFVITCAAGSLSVEVVPGNLVIVREFLGCAAHVMPLYAGEFVNPGSVLKDDGLWLAATDAAFKANLPIIHGKRHVYWRGPHFESHEDKIRFRSDGADTIGMSVLPECAVAALHEDTRVLALAMVTNDVTAPMAHEKHVSFMKAQSAKLGPFLEELFKTI